MKEVPGLSLCGLNCALCLMQIGHCCSGCAQNDRSCKIKRCALEHKNVHYCFECPKYPCPIYLQSDHYDSFITYQHRQKDLEKAKTIGIKAYNQEQSKKRKILDALLMHYNDGRKKSFYCLAVNLLGLDDLQQILMQVQKDDFKKLSYSEQCAWIKEAMESMARQKNIQLRLRKKPLPKGNGG